MSEFVLTFKKEKKTVIFISVVWFWQAAFLVHNLSWNKNLEHCNTFVDSCFQYFYCFFNRCAFKWKQCSFKATTAICKRKLKGICRETCILCLLLTKSQFWKALWNLCWISCCFWSRLPQRRSSVKSGNRKREGMEHNQINLCILLELYCLRYSDQRNRLEKCQEICIPEVYKYCYCLLSPHCRVFQLALQSTDLTRRKLYSSLCKYEYDYQPSMQDY